MGRRSRRLWVLPALGVAVATVVVTAVLWDRYRSDDLDSASAGGDTISFVVPTGPAEIIDSKRVTVRASSHLPPAGEITYDPRNMIDNDPLTAWNSDAPETDGRGERMVFRFAEPVDLKTVRLVNGYAKSDEVYAANHRLHSVLVTTDQSSQLLNLLDTSEVQEISFDFGLTSKVELEVVDVFTGMGFADADLSADLAVSEVSFLAVQR